MGWLQNFFKIGSEKGFKNDFAHCYVPGQACFLKRANPLPTLVKGLYTSEMASPDKFARVRELQSEAQYVFQKLAKVFLPDHNEDAVREACAVNHHLLFYDPDIYNNMFQLKKEGLEKLYRNNLGTSILLHIAAAHGKRRYGPHMEKFFLPILYGIFHRFLGFHQLDARHLRALLNQKRFDPFDKKDWTMRDSLPATVQAALKKMAEGGLQIANGKFRLDMGEQERLSRRAFNDVVRYSMLLEGRASEDVDNAKAASIDEAAQMVAVFSSVYGGHHATGKPFSLLVAEEYVRSVELHRKASDAFTGKLNFFAIQDLMHLLQMHVLENFQGSGHAAIYAERENLIISRDIRVQIRAEGKTQHVAWNIYHPLKEIAPARRDPTDIARCKSGDPKPEELQLQDYQNGQFRPSMRLKKVGGTLEDSADFKEIIKLQKSDQPKRRPSSREKKK